MNKIAIVTGSASGFGYEFAKLLAKDSYNLILIDKNTAGLKQVEQELLHTYTIDIELLFFDLSKPGSALKIYSAIKHRPVDVLINNAGYGLFGFFSSTNWQREEEMIHLHILTLTHLTKLILKDMISNGRGRIMNVSSVAAFQPGPLMTVYYATKAYILFFTEALANEVKGTGVTITAFCPGQTDTNFQKTVALYSMSKLSATGKIMADPVEVALYAYTAMKAGKSIAIPGMLNKIILQMHRFMPRSVTLKLVRYMQEKIRE